MPTIFFSIRIRGHIRYICIAQIGGKFHTQRKVLGIYRRNKWQNNRPMKMESKWEAWAGLMDETG
jgi:hypothetical protein